MSIPEIKDYSKGRMIPPEVAEPRVIEEPESRPFLISYLKYNDDLCEIDESLVKNCQKKALQDLKKIGRDIYSYKDFESKGIDKIPVQCKGDYKKLFNKLFEEVELFEHKLQNTARIFYFLDNLKKVMYIVAITQKHFETDKVRR